MDAAFADAGDGARRLTVAGTGEDLALARAVMPAPCRAPPISTLPRWNATAPIRSNAPARPTTRPGSAPKARSSPPAPMPAPIWRSAICPPSAPRHGWRRVAEATLWTTRPARRPSPLTGTATDLALRQAGAERDFVGETCFNAAGALKNGTVTLETARIDHPQFLRRCQRHPMAPTRPTRRRRSLRRICPSSSGGCRRRVDAPPDRRQRRGPGSDLTGTARNLRVGNAQPMARWRARPADGARRAEAGGRFDIQQFEARNPQLSP